LAIWDFLPQDKKKNLKKSMMMILLLVPVNYEDFK
jgi:hypothetical protein